MASAALIPVSPLCEHPEQAHPATPPPPPLPDPPPSHLPSAVAAATPCWYRTTFSALFSLFDSLDYTRVESDSTVLTSFSPAAAPPPAPSLHRPSLHPSLSPVPLLLPPSPHPVLSPIPSLSSSTLCLPRHPHPPPLPSPPQSLGTRNSGGSYKYV